MIDELHVQDVALIHDATMRPAQGLTVLTGETGAGKSALLSSVKLLMGERADASAVREGADALVVEGRFFLAGGDPDGTVVRRRVGADGRGRVSVDGRMSSVRELSQGVGASVDLCGQHEHQRLLQQASHVELLDAWAGDEVTDALQAYKDALSAERKASAELERVRKMCLSASERVDEATFVMNRIDEVNPREGELEELEEALPRIEHAEALMRSSEEAREAIVGEDGAADLVSQALSELRDAQRYDNVLKGLATTLEGTLIDLEDVASELRDYRDRVDFDPSQLDEMQSRMAQLRGLLRSYGPSIEDVFERRSRAAELVMAADNGEELLSRAEKERDAREHDLRVSAARLDDARKLVAPKLAAQITAQMARLEMGSAELEVAFEELGREHWNATGPSKVELLYRPAAGLTARPLRRIASGGEISRVMLACKVVLGEADATETLVFDEVDAGVGGATAVALANVLGDLAKTHQVIVVTHLPQVAIRGTVHYVVRKSNEATADGVPQTTIDVIDGEQRVREIARMLSGDISDASLAHAREMLAHPGAEQ